MTMSTFKGDSAETSILIVEDDVATQRLLEVQLLDAGCTSVAVYSAAQAAKLLSRGRQFDMILLDVDLPGCNGIALLRWLHSQHSQMPVVMMTAAPDVIDEIVCIDLGACGYLSKPFSREELLRVVFHATEGGRTFYDSGRESSEMRRSPVQYLVS